jgi:predicted dehydrogenase
VTQLVKEVLSGRGGAIRSAVGYYNKGVLNNGGHLVDLLLRLLGPLEVIAAATPVHDHWGNDPTVSGLLRSKDGHVPVCLAPANAKDYALFELELVCELGVIRMRNGGMQWDTRHAEPSPHFTGYRDLGGVDSRDGDYLQAMTLAVTEIYQHLSQGTATRSAGDHALAVQAICEQLLAAATHAVPLTN